MTAKNCFLLNFLLLSFFYHCTTLYRFNPPITYKRTYTPLNTTGSMPMQNVSSNMGSSSGGVRRNYGPMSNTSSNMPSPPNTRKPRSYVFSSVCDSVN